MARPRGVKSTYTVSEAAREQRRTVAKLSRPGKRPDDQKPSHHVQLGHEAQWRAGSEHLSRKLCLTTAQWLTYRLEMDVALEEKIRKQSEHLSALDLAVALKALMTTAEVTGIYREVQSRAGLPIRTQMEVAMKDAPLMMVAAKDEMAEWEARERGEDHAALLPAAGNGHADISTQH